MESRRAFRPNRNRKGHYLGAWMHAQGYRALADVESGRTAPASVFVDCDCAILRPASAGRRPRGSDADAGSP
jgi:hypothetical protein